jgi:hypothetical protein
VSPVPDYIYQSQPRCASSWAEFDPRRGGPPAPANWSCPRTAPYEPILAIPVEVRHIDPDWADCVGGINGVYDPPIALTPAVAIANPTMPGGVSVTTSEAVPASTPRPTLATATPTVESNNAHAPTSTSEVQDPRPDSSRVDGAFSTQAASKPPKADSEQTDVHDPSPGAQVTTQTEHSRSIDPTVNTVLTQSSEGAEKGSTVLYDPPESDLGDPGDRSKSHGMDAASKPQTDALSVLLAAQSSIDAATRPQDHAEITQLLDPPATRTDPIVTFDPSSDDTRLPAVPDPIAISMADGGSVSIHRAGSSIVVQHSASSVTVAPGSEVSLGTHIFGAASDGKAIIIDHSVTRAMPAPNVPTPTFATFEAEDKLITAYRQGSVVVVADGTQTLTAQYGGAVTINSHSVNIATDGHELVLGSSTVVIPVNNDYGTDVSTAVWTSEGSTFTAVAQGASVILRLPDTTATLAVGATTSVGGETFSALVSGGFLVHGSSTLTLMPVGRPGLGDATTLLQDDQKLVVSADGSGVVVQHGTSTITLAAGQETTYNGHVLSAAQSGAALIVDGSAMTLPSTDLPVGSLTKVEGASNSQVSDATDATNAVKVATSSPTTSQPSIAPSNAASGSRANLDLCLLLTCFIICVWAIIASAGC